LPIRSEERKKERSEEYFFTSITAEFYSVLLVDI
jgi:hypothetical protein